jgi:hypothetical protein
MSWLFTLLFRSLTINFTFYWRILHLSASSPQAVRGDFFLTQSAVSPSDLKDCLCFLDRSYPPFLWVGFFVCQKSLAFYLVYLRFLKFDLVLILVIFRLSLCPQFSFPNLTRIAERATSTIYYYSHRFLKFCGRISFSRCWLLFHRLGPGQNFHLRDN